MDSSKSSPNLAGLGKGKNPPPRPKNALIDHPTLRHVSSWALVEFDSQDEIHDRSIPTHQPQPPPREASSLAVPPLIHPHHPSRHSYPPVLTTQDVPANIDALSRQKEQLEQEKDGDVLPSSGDVSPETARYMLPHSAEFPNSPSTFGLPSSGAKEASIADHLAQLSPNNYIITGLPSANKVPDSNNAVGHGSSTHPHMMSASSVSVNSTSGQHDRSFFPYHEEKRIENVLAFFLVSILSDSKEKKTRTMLNCTRTHRRDQVMTRHSMALCLRRVMTRLVWWKARTIRLAGCICRTWAEGLLCGIHRHPPKCQSIRLFRIPWVHCYSFLM